MTKDTGAGTIIFFAGQKIDIPDDQINDLIKRLRDIRHELGIVPADPVDTAPERTYSADGETVATVGATPEGHLFIDLVPGGTLVLDGRQETVLFNILKERHKARQKALGPGFH